jgi:hypothetical protein
MSASHDDVAELLGAYALHAVDPDEQAEIERHLEGCPRCRAEVADHRWVATQLGNSGGDAPDGLWDRIASTLEETAPPMRLDLPVPQGQVVPLAPRRRQGNRLVVAALAAAAAVVIGLLGAQVLSQDDRIDDLQVALEERAILSAANVALSDPSAERARLQSPDGAISATAVLLADGTGYLMADGMPALDDDLTYQLWGQTDGGLISLGLLGADPNEVVAFQAADDVQALAVTREQAPGVAQSQNPPALAGTFD